MRIHHFIRFVFATVFFLAFTNNKLSAYQHADELEGVLEKILKAWDSRAAQSESVTASWKHGSLNSDYWSTYQADTNIIPEAHNLFLLKNDSYMYETTRHNRYSFREFSGFESKYAYLNFNNAIKNHFKNTECFKTKPFNYSKIYNFELHTELFTREDSNYSFALLTSVAKKKKDPRAYLYNDLIIAPFLLSFRPHLSHLKKEIRKENLKYTYFNGEECILLSQIENKLSFSYWIDPNLNYSIVRMKSFLNKNPCTQLDIEYTRQNSQPISPVSWKAIVFNDQGTFPGSSQIFQYAQFDVEHCDFNSDLSSDQFILALPDQTLVCDEVNNKQYLHVKNNVMRDININERTLFASDTFSTTNQDDQSKALNWKLVFGCVLFLIAYLLFKIHGFYKTRAQNSPQT